MNPPKPSPAVPPKGASSQPPPPPAPTKKPTIEHERLAEGRRGGTSPVSPWKKWGPYVSERAWGTVREDYSADGDAWAFFPHDQARSRAYRWNEDGLAGIRSAAAGDGG